MLSKNTYATSVFSCCKIYVAPPRNRRQAVNQRKNETMFHSQNRVSDLTNEITTVIDGRKIFARAHFSESCHIVRDEHFHVLLEEADIGSSRLTRMTADLMEDIARFLLAATFVVLLSVTCREYNVP